jgi:hypothetical protein
MRGEKASTEDKHTWLFMPPSTYIKSFAAMAAQLSLGVDIGATDSQTQLDESKCSTESSVSIPSAMPPIA